MSSLVEKKRNKMVMEMMFWFVVVVGMEEYMEGRMVEFSVGKKMEKVASQEELGCCFLWLVLAANEGGEEIM